MRRVRALLALIEIQDRRIEYLESQVLALHYNCNWLTTSLGGTDETLDDVVKYLNDMPRIQGQGHPFKGRRNGRTGTN